MYTKFLAQIRKALHGRMLLFLLRPNERGDM